MEREDMNKLNYEAPKAAVVLLEAESNFLSSTSFGGESDNESVGVQVVGDGNFWNP